MLTKFSSHALCISNQIQLIVRNTTILWILSICPFRLQCSLVFLDVSSVFSSYIMCSEYVLTMLQLNNLIVSSMMCAETISSAYFSCIFNVRAPTCIVSFSSGDAFWLWMHSGVSWVIEVRLDYSYYLLMSYCGISGTWTHSFRYVSISQAYTFNIWHQFIQVWGKTSMELTHKWDQDYDLRLPT